MKIEERERQREGNIERIGEVNREEREKERSTNCFQVQSMSVVLAVGVRDLSSETTPKPISLCERTGYRDNASHIHWIK